MKQHVYYYQGFHYPVKTHWYNMCLTAVQTDAIYKEQQMYIGVATLMLRTVLIG